MHGRARKNPAGAGRSENWLPVPDSGAVLSLEWHRVVRERAGAPSLSLMGESHPDL